VVPLEPPANATGEDAEVASITKPPSIEETFLTR
jgi:hypothetical protein